MGKKTIVVATASHVLAGMLLLSIAGGDTRSSESVRNTALPEVRAEGEMSVEQAIAQRRSVRSFAEKKLDLTQISQLAWAAQGITDPKRGYRAAPSAGALYPLEVYLVTPDGTYHYAPRGHRMTLVAAGDLRGRLATAALGQKCVANAPLDVVIAAVYERTMVKYGRRGIRYVHMEAGHAAENIVLQAVALGLGAVTVGAFDDSSVKEVIGLPQQQEPLYIIPVGYPE